MARLHLRHALLLWLASRNDEDCGHLRSYFVGIVPHFTGPIATAALVHSLGTFSGPLLMEYNFEGRELPHLPFCLDFKIGKLYPNGRPGLGVELDMSKLTQIMEVTKYDTNRAQT